MAPASSSLNSANPAVSWPRPVAEQMLSIRVRDVRPQVEVGQETVQLPEIGRPLSLLWRWRSGGCLGPQAAAAMNSRQRISRSSRPTEEPPLDRGACGGWHLDLVCPLCSRACRRLFAPRWSEPARPSSRPWGCRACHRVTYESSNRPGSKRGRRPPSYRAEKHVAAAIRIRRDFMGLDPETLEVSPAAPKSLHRERLEALSQLAMAHDALAAAALGEVLNRYALQLGRAPAVSAASCWVAIAEGWLRDSRWATRQSSWHRGGRPRPGPSERD